MKRGDRFVLENDYNGAILTTDGISFFAEDNHGKVIAEAKSLQAVKNQVLKPVPLDIDAVELSGRWSDEHAEPRRVHIYAVSPSGAILYQQEDGKKVKDNYDTLRRFDQAKLDKYLFFRKQKLEAEQGIEKLLKGWPKLKARELREGKESTVEDDD